MSSNKREGIKSTRAHREAAQDRRRQQAAALSKQRYGAILSAKRLRYNDSEGAAEEMAHFDSPAAAAEAVRAAVRELEGCSGRPPAERAAHLRAVRRLLGIPDDPPLEAAVQAGAVKLLIRELQGAVGDAGSTEPAMEAAWGLTNIAGGEYSVCREVMEAAPLLIMLVSQDPTALLSQQCTWALGNLAADAREFRDTLVANGAVVPVARMMLGAAPSARGLLPPVPPKAATTAAWALSNLCRGAGATEIGQLLGMEGCPEILVELLVADPKELATEVAWVLTYVTCGPEALLHVAVNAGLLAPLITRFVDGCALVDDGDDLAARVALTPLLRTLGNIVAGGGPSVTSSVLQEAPRVLPALLRCLNSPHRGLQKETAWVLSSICGIQGDLGVRATLQAGALAPLIHLLKTSAFDIRKEVGFVVANICAGGGGGTGHPELLLLVLAEDDGAALPAFLLLVTCQDAEASALGIQLVEMVLRCVPRGPQMVEEADGIDALEQVQFHGPERLQGWAAELVDTYYGEDYGMED